MSGQSVSPVFMHVVSMCQFWGGKEPRFIFLSTSFYTKLLLTLNRNKASEKTTSVLSDLAVDLDPI